MRKYRFARPSEKIKKRIAGLLLVLLGVLAQPGWAQSQLMRSSIAASHAMQTTRGAATSADMAATVTAPGGALARAVAAQVPLYTEDKSLTRSWERYSSLVPAQRLGGIFLARPSPQTDKKRNKFSGTIIKTVYEGKEEIYGVITTHSLVDHVGDPSLGPTFTAEVYVEGTFVSVPAKIVQISSPNVLDLALVKFPADVEGHLQPLEIADREALLGEELQTLGFGQHFPIYLPDRFLVNQTSLYLRTSIDLGAFDRRGLCGAPVLDKDGHLLAFHTGTTVGKTGEPVYVGHATRARFINTLLEAYHHSGKATVPFELHGRKMMDLEINEAVSYVELLNVKEEVLWERAVGSKFPYRKVEKKIREFHPRYIDFVTSLVNWEDNVLVSRTKLPQGSVSYRYDLYTGQTHRYEKKK